MPACAIHQILERHLVHGGLRAGDEVGVRADQMLCQDGTGTLAFLHLAKLEQPRALGKFAICYVDQSITQESPEGFDVARFLQTSCAHFKVHFSKPGNGIGSQIHLERFAVPAQLVLGAASHVAALGGLGVLAIHVGALDLAVALTGAPHYFLCPTVMRIVLHGELRPWCSAKDVVLHLLGRLGGRNNSGVALEYCGRGAKTLSVFDRATIAGLGSELGVVASLFPADEVTRTFLAAQGRGRDYHRVDSAPDADVAEEFEVDLGKIVPMVAIAQGPDRFVPVRDLAGSRVHQVAIGGCTNGSFDDLAKVALILKRRKVHADSSLSVAPSSRQVLRNLVEHDLLKDILDAGARLAEPSCGSFQGRAQSLAGEWVIARTGGRNDGGRCGSLGSDIYLVSPETAAATAIRCTLSDPRDLRLAPPRLPRLRRFVIEDSLIVPPPRKGRVEVERGPKIVDPPYPGPLPASLAGEAVLKLGDDLSTDQLLPASNWAMRPANIQEYARHAFERIDPLFLKRTEENKERGIVSILIAGTGYGCGADQEYASLCSIARGVRMVLAKSFDRLCSLSLIHHGIVPLTFVDDRGFELVHRDDLLEFPWLTGELKKSEMITVRNPEKGYEFKVKHGFTRRQIDILLAGGLFHYVAS